MSDELDTVNDDGCAACETHIQTHSHSCVSMTNCNMKCEHELRVVPAATAFHMCVQHRRDQCNHAYSTLSSSTVQAATSMLCMSSHHRASEHCASCKMNDALSLLYASITVTKHFYGVKGCAHRFFVEFYAPSAAWCAEYDLDTCLACVKTKSCCAFGLFCFLLLFRC